MFRSWIVSWHADIACKSGKRLLQVEAWKHFHYMIYIIITEFYDIYSQLSQNQLMYIDINRC